jgi:lysine 2,3-aminomutase
MRAPLDRFAEKVTPHLLDLAQTSAAVRTMYLFDPAHENLPIDRDRDLFFEKALTRTKGLVQKYRGRALFLLSYTCAANCRFCERQDRVGVGLDTEGRLSSDEIRRAVEYIAGEPTLREVVFSGGDPLTHPLGLLETCRALAAVPHVKVLRIHTRFPVQMPDRVDVDLLSDAIRDHETFYFSVHIDHPDELTPTTEAVLRRIRRLGYVMLCQSVFLRGVNDDPDVLAALFTRLHELGIRPYYIYHCQPIPTTMRFVMSLEDEVRIMTVLRERLSGLAFPQHVLELQHTTGKLIVPTAHWRTDLSQVTDFVGRVHEVADRAMRVQDLPSHDDLTHGVIVDECAGPSRGPAIAARDDVVRSDGR